MAFLLAQHRLSLNHNGDDQISESMNNGMASTRFIDLATDLEVLPPKVVEDVYKSHLENRM